MTYTVKYKKIGNLFWKKLKNIKGDGFLENCASRFFITTDEERIEIPQTNIQFKFSKERFFIIKTQMESEAGQKLPIKTE